MRDITRLIALAIIAFAITALAVVLDNPNLSDSIGRRLGLVAEPPGTAPHRLTENNTIVRVPRPHLTSWVGLQGFPSQVVVQFPMARDSGVIGGQLQLDIESQLVDQGDGLLRVLINGLERDAIVLERGTHIRKLTYDLSPSDLVAGSVVVTLHGNGTTNYGQICPTNVTNLGAAIEVLPSSALLLQLDKPLSGPAAIAIFLPDPLRLDAAPAPALAAWGTQWLSRQSVPTVLATSPSPDLIKVLDEGSEPISGNTEQGLTLAGSNGVTALGALRGAALPASYGQSWPLPIEALTTDVLTHTFRGSSRWTLRYKLADLPEGSAPASLNLSFRTSPLRGDNYWTVRVLLNGSLIHAANHPGTGDTVPLDIPLPLELQGLANEIVITLVDNTPNQGICRAGPEAAAQLLPSSRLDAAPAPSNDKQALVKALARASDAGIRLDTGSPFPAAEFLAGMLDLILPLDTQVKFGNAASEVKIEIVDGERARSLLSGGKPEGARNAFLLFPSRHSRPDEVAVVHLAEAASSPAAIDIGPTALLVTW